MGRGQLDQGGLCGGAGIGLNDLDGGLRPSQAQRMPLHVYLQALTFRMVQDLMARRVANVDHGLSAQMRWENLCRIIAAVDEVEWRFPLPSLSCGKSIAAQRVALFK